MFLPFKDIEICKNVFASAGSSICVCLCVCVYIHLHPSGSATSKQQRNEFISNGLRLKECITLTGK